MAMEWKDSTSYRRGEDRVPREWTLKVGSCQLTVCTGHIYFPPEQWVGLVSPFDNEADRLAATTAEAAKLEIIERARVILTEALAALPE